jgi:hypothetical protein
MASVRSSGNEHAASVDRKTAMTAAAEAALRGDPEAVQLAERVLRLLDEQQSIKEGE